MSEPDIDGAETLEEDTIDLDARFGPIRLPDENEGIVIHDCIYYNEGPRFPWVAVVVLFLYAVALLAGVILVMGEP